MGDRFRYAVLCLPLGRFAYTWFSVNQGATARLNQVLSSGTGPYNGTSAVTVYVNEARSSNAV